MVFKLVKTVFSLPLLLHITPNWFNLQTDSVVLWQIHNHGIHKSVSQSSYACTISNRNVEVTMIVTKG